MIFIKFKEWAAVPTLSTSIFDAIVAKDLLWNGFAVYTMILYTLVAFKGLVGESKLCWAIEGLQSMGNDPIYFGFILCFLDSLFNSMSYLLAILRYL